MGKEIASINGGINVLVDKIYLMVQQTKVKVIQQVDNAIVIVNWHIGQYIVEFEQEGNNRAQYGKSLLTSLSKILTIRIGKGYSRSNLQNMRRLYLYYPICQTVSGKLSWSHWCEILELDDKLERQFYEKECVSQSWSVRTLHRQIESGLFMRLAASLDKKGILALAEKGAAIEKPQDSIKDTYVLEFLGIPAKKRYSETSLEKLLIINMQKFLLELGKGFAFIGEQYSINIGNAYYYVDLVFYHAILKCYVLIDLKRNGVKHQDIGQMNMYLGYFAKEVSQPNDNPPIGIILGHSKNDLMVEYAMYGMDSNIFVSKYQLYLPNKEELRQLVQNTLTGA